MKLFKLLTALLCVAALSLASGTALADEPAKESIPQNTAFTFDTSDTTVTWTDGDTVSSLSTDSEKKMKAFKKCVGKESGDITQGTLMECSGIFIGGVSSWSGSTSTLPDGKYPGFDVKNGQKLYK